MWSSIRIRMCLAAGGDLLPDDISCSLRELMAIKDLWWASLLIGREYRSVSRYLNQVFDETRFSGV